MEDKLIELQLFIEDNFEPFRQALMQSVKTDLPTDPENLWKWVRNFIQINGETAGTILQEAISNMEPLAGAKNAKSGQSGGWSGVVNTGLQVIGSIFGQGNSGQGNEQFAAFAQAQLESQRRTTNTILIVMGSILAIGLAIFMFVKLKK